MASGTALKATNGWGVNGTDNYGFTALPGGRRLNDGSFVELGSFGYWWTTQSVSSQDAQFRFMNSSAFVNSDLGFKTRGMSVRCVQD